jgi:hypothetical protein
VVPNFLDKAIGYHFLKGKLPWLENLWESIGNMVIFCVQLFFGDHFKQIQETLGPPSFMVVFGDLVANHGWCFKCFGKPCCLTNILSMFGDMAKWKVMM